MIKIYENGTEIFFQQWKFPGGEVGIKLREINPDSLYNIQMDYESSDCVFIFLNICDALKELGVPRGNINCTMKYVPYARQDRVCSAGESKALDIFIEILSNAHCDVFLVTDVHSEVTLRLMREYGINYKHISQNEAAFALPIFDVLVAPDKGAKSKAKGHLQVHKGKTELVHLCKTRGATGVVYEDFLFDTIQGSVCVVDDLCDGGATFLSLAEMLKRTQPNITNLSLYVTHGLFSKGTEELLKFYDTIYVSNMMYQGTFDASRIKLI